MWIYLKPVKYWSLKGISLSVKVIFLWGELSLNKENQNTQKKITFTESEMCVKTQYFTGFWYSSLNLFLASSYTSICCI